MDDKTLSWVWEKRREGLSEEQIRSSLQESGWAESDINKLVTAKQPTAKNTLPGKLKTLKMLYSAVAVFSILFLLLVLLSLGVIGNKRIDFTYEKCVSLEIPTSACDSLQSFINEDPLEVWVAPTTIAVLGEGATIDDMLPTDEIPSIDLNTWQLSEVVNIGSATICATTPEQLYLVLLSDSTDNWLVEIILQLDEMGTNPLFGTTSYCQSHI